MGKKYRILTVTLLSLIVIGFFLSIYITIDEEMPQNALVIVTSEDKLYHSIHFDHICVMGKSAKTLNLSEAATLGYKPHQHDQDLGYFRGNRNFLFHHILHQIGFQVNSRWDKEGNWLW
jgi:hypothetical protein